MKPLPTMNELRVLKLFLLPREREEIDQLLQTRHEPLEAERWFLAHSLEEQLAMVDRYHGLLRAKGLDVDHIKHTLITYYRPID